MDQNTETAPLALVVDDDALIRQGVTDLLTEAGYKVLQADHGDAAYAVMQERDGDVALLFTDVQMPGTLDGFALARAVDRSWPHVSIIVVSGHETPETTSMPRTARFVSKPFTARTIHAHLQALMPSEQEAPPPLGAVARTIEPWH